MPTEVDFTELRRKERSGFTPETSLLAPLNLRSIEAEIRGPSLQGGCREMLPRYGILFRMFFSYAIITARFGHRSS